MPRQSFERDIPQQPERGIVSNNFGGLNTIASPLNIPYEDSPHLLNIMTDISGNVEKRKGTQIIYRSQESTDSVSTNNFTTGLNYNFVVCKKNKDIRVFEIYNDVATQVMLKSNVWSDAASAVRPSVVSTSEVEPRIIFMTGTNKPVQLKFVEQQQTQASTASTIVFNNASRFINGNNQNVLLYVNRVRKPTTTTTYNAGAQTFTVGSSGVTINAGDVVDIILITWQWWAEGEYWYGDRIYGSVNRFNTVPTDQNVAIPEKLRNDLPAADTANTYWDISVYDKGSRPSSYTYSSTNQPNGSSQYSYGDGTRYTYSATDYANPTPYFITFGGLQAGGNSSTVYLMRRRHLQFNNDTGTLSANVQVFVDGILRSQALTAGDPADLVYKNYWLYSPTATIGTGNVSTEIATHIGFDCTRLGVPSASVVEWVNTETSFVGSSANTTRFNYSDGNYEIAYGLGRVASYNYGYYPRTVTLYQGRLVLGGFVHRPLTLLFSGLNDTAVAGKFYMDYQITDDEPSLANKPFDIILSSKPDDFVVTTVEWQASLFVLTRKASFRLHGGDSPVTPTSKYVNFISNTGCVNEGCVSQTDFSVVYLSDTGLYDLTPQVENGEYQVRERSLKIRDKFGLTDDPRYESLPWVKYDADNRVVMVGYPASGSFYTTRYIYVYNTFRDSWTEYATQGGFRAFDATPYTDRLHGSRFLCACTVSQANGSSVPVDFLLLKFNDTRYIDFRQKATHTTSGTYFFTGIPDIQYTVTEPLQKHYAYNYTLTQNITAFPTVPITEVEDVSVSVTLSGGSYVQLVKDVDFVKEQSGYIYILRQLSVGDLIVIRQRSPDTGIHVNGLNHLVFYKDNVLSTDYTISIVSGYWHIVPTSTTNGTVLEWGNAYLSFYTTPLLTLNSFANYKRLYHAYLFFDNREGVALFPGNSVNTTSGQNAQQIVDTYTTRINCNISIMYNSDLSGETTYDLYGFDEVYWDDYVLDIAPPVLQGQPFQMFKEPLQGIGYSYQLAVWNYNDATFKLCGYMLDSAVKGKRYTSRY